MMPILEGPAATALPDSSALSESVTVAIGRPSAVPVSSFRLCLTLAECPSLKLPDLKPILTSNGGDEYPPPTATRVDTTTKPGRVLLRFASSNVNLGGLLHLVADPVQTGATRRGVRQLVYGHGVVYVREAGQFVYHPAHHHFHVGDFERYELLSANRTRVLRTSAKISFCLTDIQNIAAPARTDGSLYLDLPPLQCGAQEQGINSGFADYYGRELPDQWIDMTGLPAGTYWVRIRANPSRLLLEADTANNSTEFRVTYHGPGA
jgi:hypothetical protein